MYKGENKHCGDVFEDFQGYSNKIAYVNEDYQLFLFTDGFQDQFGGEENKKFSFRRTLELFEDIIFLSLKEQGQTIQQVFENWKGAYKQTDDMTVIGIKKEINNKQ